MKLNEFAYSWSKSWPLALVLYATALLVSFFFSDFDLAPESFDMIGEATLNNIRVSARVSFYFRAAGLFLGAVIFSAVIVMAIFKVTGGDLIINKLNLYSKIAIILCLQQLLFNDISFFFALFFLFAFSFFLIYFIFFSGKEIPYLQTVILMTALALSFFISTISAWLFLLFLTELLFFSTYTTYAHRWEDVLKRYLSRHQWMYLTSSISIGSILSYLFLKPKIDLSDTLVRLYKEKNFSAIPFEAFVLPLFCTVTVYIFFKKLKNRDLFENIGWICFASLFTVLQFTQHYLPSLLMLLAFFAVVVMKKGRTSRVVELYSLVNDVLISISFFYLLNQFFYTFLERSCDYLLPFFFLTLVFVRRKLTGSGNILRYYKYALGIILSPVILFLSQEIVMVLNQRSVFIGTSGYVAVLILLFLLVILFLVLWKPQKWSSVFSVSFAFAVAGMALYNAYHPVFNGTIDFFEEASAALAIKRTYLHHEIPLFQHFSPHNFNDYLTGLLYAWINKDVSLGYKVYTCLYALFFLLYYYFLARLFKSRFYAILWVLFSVSLQVLFPFYHAVAVLFFLVVYKYFSNRYSFNRLVCTAPLLFLLLLFRPDTGFALFITSCVGVFFMAGFFNKGWFKLKRLFIAVVIVSLVCLFTMISLLGFSEIWENIQLVTGYLQSAQSWGYATVSKIFNYKFRFHYFILPAGVAFILVSSILQKKSFQKWVTFHGTALIFFCIYYLVNFQRGLIRHSFIEQTDDNVSSFAFLIFSLYISVIAVKRTIGLKFVFVFLTSSFLFIWLFKFPRPPVLRSLYSASVDKIRTENLPVFAESKVSRFTYMSAEELSASKHTVFVFSRIDQMRNYYRSRDMEYCHTPQYAVLENASLQKRYQTLTSLLRDNHINGYVDEVCYQPLTNYFLNEKPAHFFNQGFHFYHTNKLQKKFVDEMITNNVRFVLVSNVSSRSEANSLDHVPHSIRHYYAVQHIYEQYRPQLIVDGMALWAKDSMNVNSNPLFSQSYYGDSVYRIKKQFSGHKRMLLTVYGLDSVPNDVVVLNNSIAVPVSFYNKNEKKAFVLVDSAFRSIETLKLGSFADSIRLDGYEYFPDLFSSIPQTYHLKLLPFVFGQSNNKNAVDRPIGFKVAEENIVSAKLGAGVKTKGAALKFVLSANGNENGTVTVQYYKSNSLLGEYTFSLKQGNDIPYLLLVASQPNWNLSKPDAIKLKLPGKSYLSKLSIIYKDELSY